MALLTTGILLRSVPSVTALYLGTLFFGIAIACGNVLMPSLTKRNFAHRSGLVTSLYSSVLAIGAALAAGLAVPLAHQTTLGWRGSLAAWAVPAFIALLLWLPQLWRLQEVRATGSYRAAMAKLGRSRLAWQIALFMGLQSLTFYVILAWLPAILQSRGYSESYAGWMLSLSQATGILGSLSIPFFAERRPDQRAIVLTLIVLEIVALLGLLFPQFGPAALWVSLIGFVLGGSFGLALLFLVLRSTGTEGATQLSGMAQSIGYLVAATGPLLFGYLFDLTGGWFIPLASLLVIGMLKLFVGLGAARPGQVGG